MIFNDLLDEPDWTGSFVDSLGIRVRCKVDRCNRGSTPEGTKGRPLHGGLPARAARGLSAGKAKGRPGRNRPPGASALRAFRARTQ